MNLRSWTAARRTSISQQSQPTGENEYEPRAHGVECHLVTWKADTCARSICSATNASESTASS
eukprot:CAMPEP_0177538358 /NCGR_PEP_ID=MMETSP0369-20130122/58336_1 /TAXON_ID=447022 ORGANISM="Scrippsiella hangoei-like, Strain SHHI-4" /NCGR_SAMPLE_ID=MMETSP0369 /ASSEMBLY_ACC=CAM_ASM_000364 /LENGTH=62 /DNA_ID=CAMNT_0019021167 /DNA_START=37 /DNA_END=221 /DNA_ORIENTATION=-